MSSRPTTLLACIHNCGRSVAAAALTRHYARDTTTQCVLLLVEWRTSNQRLLRVAATLGRVAQVASNRR